MDRREALVKLLALGDMPRAELHAVTGWGVEGVAAVILECRKSRLIAKRPHAKAHEFRGAEVLGITQKGRKLYGYKKA